MQLPGGVVTQGVTDPSRALPRLHLPRSLTGLSVLDVGAWDGFYSFECSRRGASRVLATDSYAWDGSSWGRRDAFLYARNVLGLNSVVEDKLIDVMELSPEAVDGPFDVVLLLGVLYHLTDAITALQRVAACCRDLLIVETETAVNWLPYAAARVYPGTGLNDDPTNWYQYNIRALRGLLLNCGFRTVEVKYRTPLHRRVARSLAGTRRGRSLRTELRSQRVVLHARR
ncbi:MAG TPA: methyltransferase domain-containing protein [Acidimicrobiia bacterium]